MVKTKRSHTSSMMSRFLGTVVLLVLLMSTATALGESTENALDCGDDHTCLAVARLTASVKEINNKLEELATQTNDIHGKQAKGLEELKEKMNVQVKGFEDVKTNVNQIRTSTVAISTQLGKHSTDLLSHDGRLKQHDVSQKNEYQLLQSVYGAELGPRDCSDLRERGYNASGVYRVYPGSDDKRIEMDVYCDFKIAGQSFLVFQRRKDGRVNFERLWKDYATGFGNLNGEFWLGNEKLSALTTNRRYKLRIELEDFTGEWRWAEYSVFSVKSATDGYRLTVGGYSGNAGDSMTFHNGMKFSTKDVDNDTWPGSCATTFRGAWWHNNCHASNLNGLYLRGSHASFADGIEWYHWRGHHYSFKTVLMKIAAI